MDIYNDDKRYDEFDLRNRSWRLLSTTSATYKLEKISNLLSKTIEEKNWLDLPILLEQKKEIEYDILYDDIRNNLVLEENELIEFLDYYLKLKENNRVKFLSWLLNHYYNGSILEKRMNDAASNEDYETASIYRDLLKIKNMPSLKE